MKLDYLIHRRRVIDFSKPVKTWDLFLSAFNNSARVQYVFANIPATDKRWIVLPEYQYAPSEIPKDPGTLVFTSPNEADVILELVQRHVGEDVLKQSRLCVDITGFMRPHIMFLVSYLKMIGVGKFDVAYTEPSQYGRKEETKFSNEVIAVRQVAGFEGTHIDDIANDVLIVGVGYDNELISRVVNEKDIKKLIQLLSLPSLSADMYQESILRLDKTSLANDRSMEDRIFYAPANDPFVIAFELSEMLRQLRSRGPVGNIYLSPLATKPQALGFALFYMAELHSEPASVIFPFSASYSKETSTGVGRTWIYEVCV